jgi:hypothetical protein
LRTSSAAKHPFGRRREKMRIILPALFRHSTADCWRNKSILLTVRMSGFHPYFTPWTTTVGRYARIVLTRHSREWPEGEPSWTGARRRPTRSGVVLWSPPPFTKVGGVSSLGKIGAKSTPLFYSNSFLLARPWGSTNDRM